MTADPQTTPFEPDTDILNVYEDGMCFDVCCDCPHPDACGDYGCGKKCGVVDVDGEIIP